MPYASENIVIISVEEIEVPYQVQDKFLIKATSGKWWYKKEYEFICEYRPQEELQKLDWRKLQELRVYMYLSNDGMGVCDRHITQLRFAMESHISFEESLQLV